MCPNFWSPTFANVELDNQHSAQHSMSSQTIDIQLNIRITGVSKLLIPIMWNVEPDNQYSSQHSMSNSTIDIQLNIQCLARQSTFSSTLELAMWPNFWSPTFANVGLDNQHSAQHSMSSSTIDIQLNIGVSNVSKLLKPNLCEYWARQSTFSSTFNV